MAFVGLYIGLSGIRAGQAGLDTASQNVANANTEGYTRQRVDLSPAQAYQSAYGPVGTGVTVDGISRLRDGFLDARYRAAVGDGASAHARAGFLASMERLSGEPDLGISSRIGELWAAMEDWANDPAADASRRQVLSELAGVSETFRSTASAWDQLGADTAARLDAVVGDVNRTLQDLHDDFNAALANAEADRIGPEVLDQRDQLLDHLAELTGAQVTYNDDLTVDVTLDGQTLLSFPEGAATVSVGGDPSSVQVEPAGGGAAVAVTSSGELGGLHRAVAEDLPRWRVQLDELAETLATAVNEQNLAGARADGTRGAGLLAFDAADPAGSLEVATTDVTALAAATYDGGVAPAPYDGSNARAFADLRTTELPRPDGTGSASFESQLSDLIVGLAGDVRSSEDARESAHGIAVGAGLARSSQHGVSIDEEMVDLVRYQRAVEASARVMTTVDQMLDVLVNRVGIVGR